MRLLTRVAGYAQASQYTALSERAVHRAETGWFCLVLVAVSTWRSSMMYNFN